MKKSKHDVEFYMGTLASSGAFLPRGHLLTSKVMDPPRAEEGENHLQPCCEAGGYERRGLA